VIEKSPKQYHFRMIKVVEVLGQATGHIPPELAATPKSPED